MSNNLNIAYLSSNNPQNKKVWSGTHYSIYKALTQFSHVDILGPYEPTLKLFIFKVLNQFYLKCFNKRINYRHSHFISKAYAKYFNLKLKLKKIDVIIAPAASCEIAHIITDIPIIYITDGTFSGCLNYHKGLTNLTKKSKEEGNAIEQLAIQKSKKIIVSSEWAANSVIQDYTKNKEDVVIIPFGANFEKIPFATELLFEVPTIWKLIFVGVYWDNKGGDIAYNAFKLLIDNGYQIELTILGCVPPEYVNHPKVKIISFIDKNSEEGQEEMKALYQQHHFLLLPTRFDCTPIVINEASAFGTPSLVADTGGVAGHLKHGKNGFIIPYEDNGDKYAETIEYFITHTTSYVELRKSTRELYDSCLNWNHWKIKIEQLITSSICE